MHNRCIATTCTHTVGCPSMLSRWEMVFKPVSRCVQGLYFVVRNLQATPVDLQLELPGGYAKVEAARPDWAKPGPLQTHHGKSHDLVSGLKIAAGGG